MTPAQSWLRTAAVVLALLAVAALCGSLARTVWVLPAVADAAIAREGDNTRQYAAALIRHGLALTNAQVDKLQHGAFEQVGDTRSALLAEVREARIDAVGQVIDTRREALGAIGDVRKDLNLQLADLNVTMAAVARPAAITLERVAEVVEIETDCAASPRCLQNVLYDMKVAAQQNAKAFSELTLTVNRHLPGITSGIERAADGVGSMAQDGAKVTAEVTRPKRWYQKLWGGIKVAAYGAAAVL